MYEIGRQPIDQIAARVIQKGTHYIPKFKLSHDLLELDVPLPMYNKFPGPKDQDLTGLRVGNITIIGYFGSTKSGKGCGRWVCKCSCGKYIVLKTRTIKRQTQLECATCHKIKYITTGK